MTQSELYFEQLESVIRYASALGFPDAEATQGMSDWLHKHEADFERDQSKAEQDEIIEGMAGMIAWFNRIGETLPRDERRSANAAAEYLVIQYFLLKSGAQFESLNGI